MGRSRLSIVYYLNSLPLAWGFIRGQQKDLFELDFSPPSRCSDLLREGAVDVGLIPVIEYLRIPGLRVISGLSLAAKNRVQSVLLVSKVPAAEIRSIAADISSRTSVCLVQILLREQYHVDPPLDPHQPQVEEMLQSHDAALIIGDAALKAKQDGLFTYDLAEEWKKLTGLPFVFAFWGVRKSSGLVDTKPFRDSLEHGKACLEQITREQSAQLDLPREFLQAYLSESIDYSLDTENLEGLRTFYRLAFQHGLAPLEREIEFVE